jgi:hypothetical protein
MDGVVHDACLCSSPVLRACNLPMKHHYGSYSEALSATNAFPGIERHSHSLRIAW